MNFFDYMREWWIWATQVLVNAALWCYNQGWPWPYLGAMFSNLSSFTSNVAGYLWEASSWYDYVTDKLAQTFSFDAIWSYFNWWFMAAQNAWAWVVNAFSNVWDITRSWWSETKYHVLTWIEDARVFLQDQVNAANRWLAGLQTSWDNFKGKIPSLDYIIYWFKNWAGEIQKVIDSWWWTVTPTLEAWLNSAFKARESWWAGWQDIRDKVFEFFKDPVEFIWARFTDWFLGPEE